jgi:hypothetical protein
MKYHVEVSRDKLALLYVKLYMSGSTTVGMHHCVFGLLNKLESIGFKMVESFGGEAADYSAVPLIVNFDLSKSDLKAAKFVLVESMKPGSRTQVSMGMVRSKLLPLCEAFGIRQVVENEALTTPHSGDDADIAFDDQIKK